MGSINHIDNIYKNSGWGDDSNVQNSFNNNFNTSSTQPVFESKRSNNNLINTPPSNQLIFENTTSNVNLLQNVNESPSKGADSELKKKLIGTNLFDINNLFAEDKKKVNDEKQMSSNYAYSGVPLNLMKVDGNNNQKTNNINQFNSGNMYNMSMNSNAQMFNSNGNNNMNMNQGQFYNQQYNQNLMMNNQNSNYYPTNNMGYNVSNNVNFK